jgi:hypothetical protein
MGWRRFIACGDNHGDEIDPKASAAFLAHCKIWKPHIKIHGGDCFNLNALRKGASQEERQESMISDVDAGLRFLREYQPHCLIRGNHDERLWELAEFGTGVEGDYAQRGVTDITEKLKRFNCQMLPYHKTKGVLRIDHLKLLHGFYCGVYAARQHAYTYGSCIFFHVHTEQEFSIPGLERRVARSAGCLCNLDMRYLERRPESLKHTHGWIYGVTNDKTGDYKAWHAEVIGDKFIVTEGFKEL